MISNIFRTGLRTTHVVSAGNLTPVDTMLVAFGVRVLYQHGTKNGKILFHFFPKPLNSFAPAIID